MAFFGRSLAFFLLSMVYLVQVAKAGDTPIYPVPTECPQNENENSIVVHLAHETDCEKFYKCDHGNKVEFICPVMNTNGDRLHFNPVLQVCDWPQNAGCQLGSGTIGSPPPANVTTPSPPPQNLTTSTQPPQNLTTPTLPPLNLTTPSLPPVNLTTPTLPPLNVSTPSPPPQNTTNPPPNENNRQNCTGGAQAHECDCEKYYECLNGSLVLYECPQGEWFDTNTTLCQFSWNATCEHKPTPPPPCTVCNEDTRYIGIPSQPNNYLWCNGSLPVVERCPSYLVFNQTSRICDWIPRNVQVYN